MGWGLSHKYENTHWGPQIVAKDSETAFLGCYGRQPVLAFHAYDTIQEATQTHPRIYNLTREVKRFLTSVLSPFTSAEVVL